MSASSTPSEKKWSPSLDAESGIFNLKDLALESARYNRTSSSFEFLTRGIHWLCDKLFCVVLQRPEDEKPKIKMKDLILGPISDLDLPAKVYAIFNWSEGRFATLHEHQVIIWNAQDPKKIAMEKTFEIELQRRKVFQVIVSPSDQQIAVLTGDKMNPNWHLYDLNSKNKALIGTRASEPVGILDSNHCVLFTFSKEEKSKDQLQIKILELDFSSSLAPIKSETVLDTEWSGYECLCTSNGRFASILQEEQDTYEIEGVLKRFHKLINIELHRNPKTANFECHLLSELLSTTAYEHLNGIDSHGYVYVAGEDGTCRVNPVRIKPDSNQVILLSIKQLHLVDSGPFLSDIITGSSSTTFRDPYWSLIARTELSDALPMMTMPIVDLIGEFAYFIPGFFKPSIQKVVTAKDPLREISEFLAILDKKSDKETKDSKVTEQAKLDKTALEELIKNHANGVSRLENVSEIQRNHPKISFRVGELLERYMEDHIALAYRESMLLNEPSPKVTRKR